MSSCHVQLFFAADSCFVYLCFGSLLQDRTYRTCGRRLEQERRREPKPSSDHQAIALFELNVASLCNRHQSSSTISKSVNFTVETSGFGGAHHFRKLPFFFQSTQVGSTMEEAGNFLFPLALQASVAPLAIARWVEVSRWSSTV